MTNVTHLHHWKHRQTAKLIESACRKVREKLERERVKRCPCGKQVCIFRGDDWPPEAA